MLDFEIKFTFHPPTDITSELVKVPLKSNYHLADSEKEFERDNLMRRTKEIKGHYAHFLGQLQQHMLSLLKDGALDVSVIKNHLTMYDSNLKNPMSHCKSLQDIFETLNSPKYSSFLDYELIKVLADYGSDKIKSDFIDYKKKLQKFLEKRIIEHYSGEEKFYAVVIDESIIDEIPDLSQVENRVKNILGQKNLVLLHWENLSLHLKLNTPLEEANTKLASPSLLNNAHVEANFDTVSNTPPKDEEQIATTAATISTNSPQKVSDKDILESSEEDASSIAAIESDSPQDGDDVLSEQQTNAVQSDGLSPILQGKC